jgi:hypothetical protein
MKPHEYVLVQREMTAGDDIWIQNHAAKSRGDGQEVSLMLGDVQLATAQRLIRGWSLFKEITRPDGVKETVPILYNPQARDNIERLPRSIYAYILKKIDELNPDDDEDGNGDKEPFLPGVAASFGINWQTENESPLKH